MRRLHYFRYRIMNLDGRFYQNVFLLISLFPIFGGKCIDCRFHQHGCQENEGHEPLYSQWRWKTWGSWFASNVSCRGVQRSWEEWMGEGDWTWAGTTNRSDAQPLLIVVQQRLLLLERRGEHGQDKARTSELSWRASAGMAVHPHSRCCCVLLCGGPVMIRTTCGRR